MNSRLTFLIFLPFLVSSIRSTRSAFGEPCSETQRCDRRAWLTCVNKSCVCLNPDEMFYDAKSRKCVSRAGERCKFAFEDLNGTTAFELASCAENAVCGSDGFCSCIEDFLEDLNGTCIPTGKRWEPCDEEIRCSSLQGLECDNGTCECSKRAIFSHALNQCVGLAGQDCIRSKCSANAFCDLLTNKCTCQKGYFRDKANICSPKVRLLKNCTSDEQCEDSMPLKCTNGVCNCNSNVSFLQKGERSVDDFPDATCVGKASTPCISGRCTLGAICRKIYRTTGSPRKARRKVIHTTSRPGTTRQFRVFRDFEEAMDAHEMADTFVGGQTSSEVRTTAPPSVNTTVIPDGICECWTGFSLSKSKTCGRQYGSICEKNECLDTLVCAENKCRCRYPHQVFSHKSSSCLSKVRGPCKVTEDCIEHSFCLLYKNKAYGECRCKEGYVGNVKRECDVAYGWGCRTNMDCDSVAGLVCVDGHCDCPGFARFSAEERKCLGLVGSGCTCSSGGDSSSCIDNSVCSCLVEKGPHEGPRERKTYGTCECAYGFSVSGDYACQANMVEGEILAERS